MNPSKRPRSRLGSFGAVRAILPANPFGRVLWSAARGRRGRAGTLHCTSRMPTAGGRWREDSCSDSVLTVGLYVGPPCDHAWARLMVSRTRSGNRSAIRIAAGGLRPRSRRFVGVDRSDPPARAPTLPRRSSGSRRRRPGSGCRRLPQWLQTGSLMTPGH